MQKRRMAACLAGLGIALAGLLSGGTASADPSNPTPPPYRALNGVGSDTTQGVMDAIANNVTINGTKVIGSYDAVGSASITTGTAATCTITRPNGSGAGRTALLNSLNQNGGAGDNCLQFGRSSSLNLTASSPSLTYVPFATDAVTYAVNVGSGIPRQLDLATLQAIYHCDPSIVGTGPNFVVQSGQVYLPQAGSGTRAFWEQTMGITDADVVAGKYPCITDHINGSIIEEHDGRVLSTPGSIAPFSIAQYIAQSNGTLPDIRGAAVLGSIAGITPVALNGSFPVTRSVYNVIPTAQINSTTPPYNQVFVGPNSLVCQQTATIQQYGFAVNPNCGDTSQHS